MAVTIREIAEAAGVSIATVSRVLNKKDHPVSPVTRDRVVEVTKRLGYVPNRAAQNLRTSTSSLVAIVTDAEHSPHTDFIIQGVRQACREAGFSCLTVNAFWDPISEQREVAELLSHSVAGVVFVETWLESAGEMLQLADTPFVHTNRLFDRAMDYSVVADDLHSGEIATRHLLDLGHRRIAYLCGPPEYYASAERRRGYEQALARAGVEPLPDVQVASDWSVESGYAATRALVDSVPEVTGIFAANDRMALGSIYALSDLGRSVPDDVSIVGHDNEEFVSFVRPRLTTVELPLGDLGRIAAELLLDLVDGGDAAGREIKLRGRLVPGRSTASRGEAR